MCIYVDKCKDKSKYLPIREPTYSIGNIQRADKAFIGQVLICQNLINLDGCLKFSPR